MFFVNAALNDISIGTAGLVALLAMPSCLSV